MKTEDHIFLLHACNISAVFQLKGITLTLLMVRTCIFYMAVDSKIR